ncbi:MAG: hypothetical protein HY652_05395 [Acidobacteria bacterium]|nr:hypothetical protein [Acidobacteriota bacterium]
MAEKVRFVQDSEPFRSRLAQEFSKEWYKVLLAPDARIQSHGPTHPIA